MTDTSMLDEQIRKAAFWSAIAVVLTGALSLFLPIDSPDSSFAGKVTWLSSNAGAFIAAWIVQIVVMLALSAVFAGAIWEISDKYPLRVIVAEQMLKLSSISLPFSLSSSLDYLGFRLYAVFSLLVARPLFHVSSSARIAGFAFAAHGLLYHAMLIGVLAGAVAQAEIGVYAEPISGLLLISVIGLAFHFRGTMSSRALDDR